MRGPSACCACWSWATLVWVAINCTGQQDAHLRTLIHRCWAHLGPSLRLSHVSAQRGAFVCTCGRPGEALVKSAGSVNLQTVGCSEEIISARLHRVSSALNAFIFLGKRTLPCARARKHTVFIGQKPTPAHRYRCHCSLDPVATFALGSRMRT